MNQRLKNFSFTYLNDLLEIVQSLDHERARIAGKHYFITGGAGFLGRWLVDTLLLMDARVTVVVRGRNQALASTPYWVDAPGLTLIEGDLLNDSGTQWPVTGVDEVVHAANDFTFTSEQIYSMCKPTFDFAKRARVKRVLFVSSGAVYNSSLQKPTRFLESEILNPDLIGAQAYGAGKIMVEREGLRRAGHRDFEFKLIRGFSFLGPHQVLKSHFAAPQFFQSIIDGEPLVVQGTGDAIRSYLYPADFVRGALQILFYGKSEQPYNLGSSEAVSILDLARKVNEWGTNPTAVETLQKNTMSLSQANSYVPYLERIQKDLVFKQTINLDEAIKRTAAFYRDLFPSCKIRR